MIALSIVIPTWREGEALVALLNQLQPLRTHSVEILVADGEGSDYAQFGSQNLADHWLLTRPGRALQMQAAASQARGQLLAFLHVDSQVSLPLFESLLSVRTGWGFFPVQIVPESQRLRLVARLMNWRSRLTGIATGDQLIWVARDLFHAVGGYPEQKLMEDIALCKRLRASCAPTLLPGRVATSARRWQSQGWLKTVLLMWYLRIRYWAGSDPDVLANIYYPEHRGLHD